MFKSWRKATAGSTAGRIGRGFHRVLSRVALPAVLIAALVATPLQILTDPAEIAHAQDPITVSFAEATYNVIEGQTVTVTVEVSAAAPTGGYTIAITALQADQGERVTSLPESVTISSGQTSGELRVQATSNTEADGNYPLDLVIDSTATNFPSGLTVVTPSIARVNIIDDESPNIQLGAYSQSVFEGTNFTPNAAGDAATSTPAMWNVKLTEDPGEGVEVTVTIGSSDSGAATVESATLTFTGGVGQAGNWDQDQVVTVTGEDDDDFVDETVTFTHSASGGDYGAVATRAVRVSVTDDDTPEIIISPAKMKVQEGVTGRYTVKLNGQPNETTVVQITVPEAQQDLINVNRERITFRRGDWNRTRIVEVEALQDDDQFDNSVIISHTAEGAEFDGLSENFVVVIEDDDKPGVRVSTNRVTVGEGNTVSWRVRLNTEPTADVTVAVASPDTDAVTVDTEELTFTTSNWSREQTVTATAVQDADFSDETVSITHDADGGGYETVPVRPVAVVVDDDEEASVLLSVDALTVAEDGANSYVITLAAQPQTMVTIAVASSDTDKATVVISAQGVLSADNWETGVTVTVSAPDEQGTPVDTDDDEVTITHTSTHAEFADLELKLPVTIEDDDNPGIKVSKGSVTVFEGTTKESEDNNAQDATWTVQLNTEPTADVVVTISSSDPGAATASTAENTSVITFTNDTLRTTGAVQWDAAQTITVMGAADDDIVPEEVTFTHSAASDDEGYDGVTAGVMVTVTDDADARIELGAVGAPDDTDTDNPTAFRLTVSEGTTSSYTMKLTAQPTETTVVWFTVQNDGITINRERITFRRGDWDKPRTTLITAPEDDDDNVNATVLITHTATAGGGYDGQVEVLLVTIEDNDKAGIQVSRANIGIQEGGSGTFTARLNTEPDGDITVTVTQPAANPDPNDEVTSEPATLEFTTENWDDPQTVTIETEEDADVSDDTATIQLRVSDAPADSPYLNIQRDVEVTVNDDDEAGFMLSEGPYTVREGDDSADAFTIVLTSQPTDDVLVTFTSSDTDKADSPAAHTFSTNNWNQAHTVALDVDDEPDTPPLNTDDDSVTIMIATSVTDDEADPFHGLTGSVAVTIEDDDKAGIQVDPKAVTVFEGTSAVSDAPGADPAMWTVQLNTDPGVEVVVTITSDDTSRATATPGVITFTAGTGTWNDAVEVTVSSETDDDIVNDDVRFKHSVTSGAYAAADAEVVVTVDDNADARIVTGGLTAVPETDGTQEQQDLREAGITHTITVPEGGTVSYTLNLSARPTATTVVNFPVDSELISLNRERITFRGGDWHRPRATEITADTDLNSLDETVVITHTATAGGGYAGQMIVVQVTIDDTNKAGLQLSSTGITVAEDGSGMFTVRLNTEPTDAVTVTPSVEPANDDVTFAPATLTFTDETWEEPQTVTVSAGEDEDAVNDVTGITLTVSGDATGYGDEQNRTVSVTVDDNDSAGMTVKPTSVTVREGAQDVAAFTVVLTAAPEGTVTVAFTSSDDEKVDDPSNITFSDSDWSTPKPVQLDVDNEPASPVDTADTSARIDILTSVQNPETSADAAFHGLKASVAVAIEDDDKAGIQLSRTTQTVYEGTTRTTADGSTDSMWTVRLNTDPGVEVVVTISSSDSSRATVTPSVITFTAGTGTWDDAVEVTVSSETDDDIVNDDVRFKHSITSGAYTAADVEVVVTVTDSADATIVTDLTVLDQDNLTAAQTAAGATHSITVPEGGTASFTMNLSARPTATTVVSFAEDSDSISVSRERITFRGGDWHRARTSEITAGTDANTVDETAIITFTASAGGGYDGEMIVLEVTVDDSGKSGLQLNRTGLTIGEGGSGTFTVRLNTPPDATVTVTPSESTDLDDVSFSPATLTFTDETWEETQTITVSTEEDDDAVDDTTGIELAVSGATGYAAEQNRTVSVTVDDNDSAGMTVSETAVTITEGATLAQAFSVVLKAAPVGSVTVNVTSSDTDKINEPSNLTFSSDDWSVPKFVSLQADDELDAANTADDSATITIETEATDAADTGFNDLMTATVRVTIEDDDKPGIQVSRPTQTVFEGTDVVSEGSNTEAEWTVSLNEAPGTGETVVVTITTSDPGAATVEPSVITYTAGQSGPTTVKVRGVADNDIENETVTFTHTSDASGYGGVSAQVVVTVTDDADATIVTDLTALAEQTAAGVTHTITVPEGGTASFTMNLSARPTATTVVSFAEDSDSISVSRERITFRGGDWHRARTSEITAGTDANTVDETAIITFTASAGGGYDGEMIVLEVTVDDSGKSGLQLNRTGLTIGEGGSGTFTVRLNTPPDATVTVTPSESTDLDDVSFSPATLTFTDETWEETQTITVSTEEDDDAVDDTTGIELAVSGATGYAAEQNRTVSVTVDDNDSAGMTVSETAVTITEGATLAQAFSVVLKAAPVGSVTVNVTSSDTDKINEPSNLTFSSDDWSVPKFVSLQADDELDAANTADDSATITIETEATDAADTGFNDLMTATVRVTIEDDDKPGIQVSRPTQTVFEGTDVVSEGSNTEAEWTVSLNEAPGTGETVVVTITTSDPGAATVEPSVITYTAGQSGPTTVKVRGVADNDIENETVTFTHTSDASGYGGVSAQVVVTVTDDADATIVVGGLTEVPENDRTGDLEGVTHTITVPEGGTVSYTMNLSARPSATTVVSFAEDSDLISVSRERITFRGGDWSKVRTNVITAGEDDDSMDNTAVIRHTASAGGGYDGEMVVLQVTVDDNDKAGILLSTSSLTIDEEGEGTFTARLQTEPTGNVTLALTQPTDANADVTTDPEMLTFTADNWDDTQTVTVKAADDDDVANDTATIDVRVTASDDTQYITTAGTTARTVAVTVTDNDSAGLVLSAPSASVSEDASSTVVFTVKLAGAPPQNDDVTITITTDPATLTNVATVTPNQLTFTSANWEMAQEVSVNPDTDTDSDDESFTIKLAASGGGYDHEASVAVTISDVNKAGIKLSKSTSSIAEGATDTWTVELNTNPGAGETVKVAVVSSDTGAATVDMTELTFTGDTEGEQDGTWRTAQTVTVMGEEDSDIVDESVTFTHSVTSDNYAADAIEVTVAVEDNEAATIKVSTMAITMDEGTTASYTMELSAQPNATVVVRFSEDSDKLSVNRERITFRRNDWDKARTNEVTAAHDEDDADETITIVHTAEGDGSGYAGQTVNVVVTIKDDDTPGLMIGATSATVAEGGTTEWTVRLNTKPSENVTVTPTVAAGSGTNADINAVTVSGALTFTPDNWDDTQKVTVTGAEDPDLVNETAEVQHVVGGNADGYNTTLNRTVPVSVTDNDTASLVVRETTVAVTEGDSDVTVTDAFNVQLSAMPASQVTITVTSNNTDVEIVSGDESLTIQPSDWDTGEGVSLTIKDDSDGDNESATISLSAAGAEFAGKTAAVTVNVTDNNQPGITLNKSEIALTSDADTDTFSVVLNTNPDGNATVRVSSSDGGAVQVSAGGGQAADFVDLTFTDQDWDNTQTVTVNGQDDADVGDESVTITVAATSGYSVSSKSVAVTVEDDDTGTMTIDPTSVTVTEGSTAEYTVVLDQQPGGNVTVTLANSTPAAATVNASSLTFTTGNWNQKQTVTVTGVEDDDDQNDSTTIGHTASGGGYAITSAQNVQVTVTDNDQPELILNKDELTVAEAGGTGTYTVRLKTEPTGNVTVAITMQPTGKATVDKTNLTFSTSNWSQTQTVTVTGVPDDDDLADDVVTITNSPSGYGIAGAKTVEATVDDDDTMTWTFDMREYTVAEGDNQQITLSVNIAAPQNENRVFGISVVTSGGATHPDTPTDTNTGDYSGVPATVTITGGQTSENFTVRIRDDQDNDDGESISIVVSSAPAGVAQGAISVVTIHITDND